MKGKTAEIVKGKILNKGEAGYTYLKKLFQSMDHFQKQYNWLITDCEAYPQNPEHTDRIFHSERDDYTWISGEELTKIVITEDFQWIWAVLSAFDPAYTKEDVLKYPLPRISIPDASRKRGCVIQHPLASIELSAWDSSYTILLSKDETLLRLFGQRFPFSEDLR